MTQQENLNFSYLHQLGQKTSAAPSPEEAHLDVAPNPHPDEIYVIRFTCPEFTSLCPVTGQPDFAHLVIDYIPDQFIIESKSLKLYLQSYRNHGAFHEACTVSIGKQIAQTAKPKWLRMGGYWFPRGGIPIDVFWCTGQKPDHLFLPDQGIAPYKARF